jgi:hypothetical protein
MRHFFPHHTAAWKFEDAGSFRRISMSVVEMALITGVVLRIYRALVLSRGASGGWLYLALSFAVGFILLFGMVTLHLGNFTIRHWLWRAPAFAVVEAAAESLASVALIALQREPLGSARAAFADWPSLVRDTFFWRLLAIILFAILLAGVVQLTRFFLLKREHRDHTFQAVHTHEIDVRQQQGGQR